MAKRLIVHVGPRRTGSTSIQQMLYMHRGWLRARGVHVVKPGVHVVKPGVVPGRNRWNAGLARLLAGRSATAANRAWIRLAKETAAVDAERFVMSAEGIASPNIGPHVADRLAALARGGTVEVEVVGYVRPQWQLLESEYGQRAAEGLIGVSFAQFVAGMLAAGRRSIVDYAVVFQPFRALFGNRLRVLGLDPSALPHGHLAHFLELCGVDAEAARGTTLPSADRRWGAKHVEVCRLVSAHFDGKGRGRRVRNLWGRPDQRLALAGGCSRTTPRLRGSTAPGSATWTRTSQRPTLPSHATTASMRGAGCSATARPAPVRGRTSRGGKTSVSQSGAGCGGHVRLRIGIDLYRVAAADTADGKALPRVRRAAEPQARVFWRNPSANRLATALDRRPPSFLIIGAMRSGTTFLHNQLARHPRIGKPLHKEVHYFDFRYLEGRCWYLAQFPRRTACAMTGEASPYYMVHPLAPDRVRDFDPQMKLIVVLRDPADRALSHWRHAVRYGIEWLTFEQALAAEPKRIAAERALLTRPPLYYCLNHRDYSYLERGRYAHYLAMWLERFPRSALHVIRAAQMFENPRQAIAKAVAFLGLPPEELPSGGFRERPRKRPYAPMDPELRARLDAHFRADQERLRELLGVDWVSLNLPL